MPRYLTAVVLGAGWLALADPLAAGELSYRPTNPSFGGSPNNGAYLYNLATAQNGFKEEQPAPPTLSRDPLQSFKESLTSRMLGAMSNQIVDAMYGPNAQENGVFVVNDITINFVRQNGQLVVDIVDAATGSTTVIQLPVAVGTGG